MDDRKNLLIVLGEWWEQRRAYQPVGTIPSHSRLNHWLPSRGNVIFTLLVASLIVAAQVAGAFPNLVPRSTPDASSTGTISYQGRLADTSGTPVTALVNMEFRIYNAASGGGPLWEEHWTGANAVSVSDGLFNVMLGSLVPIPQNVVSDNNSLWLGVTAGTDDEMTPRVQLGSVPFATQALTVPDGSVTTAKIAAAAVTADKLDSTLWIDLPLAAGFVSPWNTAQYKAQYRRIGDIIYLRGIVLKQTGNLTAGTFFATLPSGFRPSAVVAYIAESHNGQGTKHRVNIYPDGQFKIDEAAPGSDTLTIDGWQFSLN